MGRVLSDGEMLEREVEWMLAERLWLPLYEEHGPFDSDLIWRLPVEQQYPPPKSDRPNPAS